MNVGPLSFLLILFAHETLRFLVSLIENIHRNSA